MTPESVVPVFFLKGGVNSIHKIEALQDLTLSPVIPAIVSAIEPDHHIDPDKLIRAKHAAFYDSWVPPTGLTFLTAVADVTTDYGGAPIRKPNSRTIDDLVLEIVNETQKRANGHTNLPITEHASLLLARDSTTRVGIATTTTVLPTRVLSDARLVSDMLAFSELSSETLLNMSGGIDVLSILCYLNAHKKLGENIPTDLVKLPKDLEPYTRENPGYIFRRLEFYERIGRIKPVHLKYIDSLTLLALLESALNIPGHLVVPMLSSLLPS